MKKSLFSKLLQGLTDNLGLKILSAVIAIVIWYLVVGYNDPMETASYTVHVEITNESYIANGKRTFTVGDDFSTVIAYIRTNRSVLKKLQASNVVVTADLTQIVELHSDPVYVPLQVSCAGVNQENITLSRTTIPIFIEDIASQKFAVVLDYGGSVPGQNYEVGKMIADTDTVTISGPESLINKIGTVKATIDVTGMTEDGKVPAVLSLMDKEQKELPASTLDALSFEGGRPNIEVNVTFWEKLSGIKLESEYSGNPAPGYQVTKVSVLPSEITVVGSKEAIASLAERDNTISIPGNLVSLGDANKDSIVPVNISKLLPRDCRLGTGVNENVQVSLTILPQDSKEYSLDVEHVKCKDLADNLTVSYDHTKVAVRVKRTDETKEELDASDIKLSIDLFGRKTGEYVLPVTVGLPEGFELVEDVKLTVRIKAKAESS
ncbi:MAG: CdaR family protein [Lachnospiraceae bacterium]|nr:CdaR family protein [Lachnospiraceae bacterium]